MKILRKQDGKSKSNWESIKKNLNLINLNVNTSNPDDPAYVFNAFCPLTIRLVEEITERGWGGIREELKKLPGFYEFPNNESMIIKPKKQVNFVLLVFIGGITYAEIAAIRFLNRTKREHKFFILTTHITSGKKIIDSCRMNVSSTLTMSDFYSQLKNTK